MEIRNPVYTESGAINCLIEHPDYGWIPFTASESDIEEHGRAIYAFALQMDVTPYVPPPEPEPQPAPIPHSISRFQARAALLAADLLSDVEAAVAAADPFAQLAWAEAQEWRRDSPTLLALAHGIGLTDAEIDDLFVQAAAIRA